MVGGEQADRSATAAPHVKVKSEELYLQKKQQLENDANWNNVAIMCTPGNTHVPLHATANYEEGNSTRTGGQVVPHASGACRTPLRLLPPPPPPPIKASPFSYDGRFVIQTRPITGDAYLPRARTPRIWPHAAGLVSATVRPENIRSLQATGLSACSALCGMEGQVGGARL
ncbi:hypothetical protein PR048_014571 [Dryococelus australis]|uniref:Uncharacterized protein n=1 Tax=Dryococelus australis TaxID=614101 RepID=A0ABQ9HFE0_9NEOP|nr:hypothetical protein PR048_014571 [Dryococelus australis]